MTLASIRVSRFVPFAATALVALAGLAIAGPLTPPSGPVASSYKTLGEVEPRIALSLANTPGDADSIFKITARGSYYLTGNVTGVAGKHGIEIAASNVTIDLEGYSLIGVAGSLDGIRTTTLSLPNITIEHGVVSDWRNSGIDLVSQSAVGSVVRDIRAHNNGVGGSFSGIRVHNHSLIEDCISSQSSAYGFDIYANCRVVNCVARSNGSNGFDSASQTSYSGCNSFANGGIGIRTDGSSSVLDCTASQNVGAGISVTDGSLVSRCVAGMNASGIVLQGKSTAIGNTCRSNQSAGIHVVTGSDNRIEENHCVSNVTGIIVATPSNLIVKNTCASNTLNWSIIANNVYGPIIDRTTAVTPAVNGNAAAAAIGTTDPNANFTY